MAEIIVEPTALSKVIALKFKINDVDVPKTTQLPTNKQFNTTDTDAWFTFELDGLASINGTYDLTLMNLDDKSIFHHADVIFPALPFHYKLNSSEDVTLNEIRHAGRWLGQLVVTLSNGDTTARQFGFDIAGHILDGQDAQVILLSDYQALINTINLAKDDLAQYNIDYAALIADVTTAEGVREQAEIDRAAVFAALVESEMVAQNVATKLTEKEATFAPRMLSLESELAETATKAELSAIATPKAVSLASQMTDTKRVYVYTGVEGGYTKGNWYYHNGTAWVSGGVYQASGIADKSVTQNTLSNNLNEAVFQKREFEWVVGSIAGANGINMEHLYRIRATGYVDGAVTITFDPDPTMPTTTYTVLTYTLEGAYLSTTGWISKKYYELPSGYRYRFVLKISDTTLIDESNIDGLIDRLKIRTPNVSQLRVEIDEINNKLETGIPISDWELGSIRSATGLNASDITRIRTASPKYFPIGTTFKLTDTALKLGFYFYEADGTPIEGTGLTNDWNSYTLNSDRYLRVLLAYDDGRDMSSTIIENAMSVTIEPTLNYLYSKVSELSSDEINNKLETGIPISDWELGSIRSATGLNASDITRIRTASPKYFPIGTTFKLTDTALKLGFYFYEADGTPIEGTGLTNDWNSYTLNSDRYLRVLLAYDDGRDMSSTIIENAMSVTIEPTLNYLYSKVSELSSDQILPFPEFVFDIPYTVGYIADHCFVKDELWVFESTTDDTHTAYANVKRYSIDIENKTGSYIGGFTHNWGHVNSIDYCEETDTLICGNGSGQYTTNIGEIYLIPNAYALKNLPTAPFETYAQIIDVHTVADWGYKHNVLWGESNDKQFNICHVITNDNKNVRKVLLGQGTNNLGSGTFVEGKTGLEFNGTYKVLKSYSQSDGLDVLQGATYYNGKLFGMLGHGRYWLTVSQLNEDGSISRKQYIDRIFDALGSEITSRYTSGVDFKNNYLITCTKNGKIKFYNSIW